MGRSFKYRVCQTQLGYVTYVNGRWQGNQALLTPSDFELAARSCPALWDYLDAAGRDGWELVTVAEHATTGGREFSNTVNLLFLKKEADPDNQSSE